MPPQEYSLLTDRLREIAHLTSTLAVLQWDQEVYMPYKGSELRAKTIGQLSQLAHERFVALDKGRTLSKLRSWAQKNDRTPEATVVCETWRAYSRGRKLPAKFVRELSELTSVAQQAWAKARAASDFKAFLPHLKKIAAMKQREAELVGYADSPYDALLDVYEPGMTVAQLSPIFDELARELKPLIQNIVASQARVKLPKTTGRFRHDKQRAFNAQVAKEIGFDFEAGRMDVSTHPFTTNFHPQDVRITTRYRDDDVLYSLGSTIHEVGHALYEQGLPGEHFGTPLGEAISLGIHESQSRIWENNIGKSLPFWHYFYPKFQRAFPQPFKRFKLTDFMRVINRVTPSLIRTEADEATYNLHVILRFEIECALIEGRLKVEDVPAAWNDKMREFFGLRVPDDKHGCLQDVHWSAGLIGYFPTYALGNLYAAQFYAAARRALPHLDEDLARGKFAPIREWLRENIHIHGKRHSSASLVKAVTGEELSSRYFIEYLKQKYG